MAALVVLALVAGYPLAEGVAQEAGDEASGLTTPAYYVGLGVRALANDPRAVVLGGKARLLAVGPASLSARAALLYGDYAEARAAVTGDLTLLGRFAFFFGGGVAYGVDGLGAYDPALSAGLDVTVMPWLALNVTVGYAFQLEADDDDKEIMGLAAFSF